MHAANQVKEGAQPLPGGQFARSARSRREAMAVTMGGTRPRRIWPRLAAQKPRAGTAEPANLPHFHSGIATARRCAIARARRKQVHELCFFALAPAAAPLP